MPKWVHYSEAYVRTIFTFTSGLVLLMMIKWEKSLKAHLSLIIFLNLELVHLWIIYIGEVCKRNCQRQQHETVLALATLGDATRNRNNPICVASPKVANASTVSCSCHRHYRLTFTNVNTATMIWKWDFKNWHHLIKTEISYCSILLWVVF